MHDLKKMGGDISKIKRQKLLCVQVIIHNHNQQKACMLKIQEFSHDLLTLFWPKAHICFASLGNKKTNCENWIVVRFY